MAKSKFLRFFALAFCFCLAPIFAGCNLVTTNVDKFLAENVASFDNGRIVISREELLITYNTTGNSRFDNSSTPTEKGIRDTIDLELKRKLLVEFLTSDEESIVQARADKNIQKVTLSTHQYNDAWQNVYDYINDTVDSLATELRTKDGIESADDEHDHDDDSEYKSYEDSLYNKQYTLVKDESTGNYVLQKVKEDEEHSNTSIALYTEADAESKTFSELAKQAYDTFRENYWHWTDSKVMNPDATNETSYSDDAWSKFINDLLRSENDRNLTKSSEDAFLRNVQMVYGIYYQNAVLTEFQNKYTRENIVISAKDVADKYRELYDAQYEKYNSNSSAFDSAVPTGAGDVYYMQKANSYMKVNHILVKFSDEQNDAIKAEKTKLDNCEIDLETYNKNVAAIKAQTMATNQQTGEKIYYENVRTEIINKVNNTNSASQKMAEFANLMHQYSEDTATLGAEACYYIPTDTSIKDSMEAAFAKASRELYNDGNGKVGDITTQWIETSYGYHIIMYTGLPTDVSSSNTTDDLLVKLDAYRLNPLYNKTMLDKIIEKITLSDYATYEEGLVDYLMGGKTIEYFPNSFSDLYK